MKRNFARVICSSTSVSNVNHNHKKNKSKVLQSDCSVEVKSMGTATCMIVFISKKISEAFNNLSTLSQFNIKRDIFKSDWLE